MIEAGTFPSAQSSACNYKNVGDRQLEDPQQGTCPYLA